MRSVKYYIGPMSKNVVDSVIEFCNETDNQIGLIPSRRQIENSGGYVNKWTTKDFSEYVKSKCNNIVLQRDHAGPSQGFFDDDGYESLKEDCAYFDLIHIDPWKKHETYVDGLNTTVDMIQYCNAINPNLRFEVGTEESIRRFEVEELNQLMIDLKKRLGTTFSKIEYLVIQSGTSLKGVKQTGQYDNQRLKKMVSVAKNHGVLSKEHNGDYMPADLIKQKLDLGLDSINIAPEFGLIETLVYLENIKDEETLSIFWKICHESGRWKKWVSNDFDPLNQKENLIKICGHYVFSDEEFIKSVKTKYDLDDKIRSEIRKKLEIICGTRS